MTSTQTAESRTHTSTASLPGQRRVTATDSRSPGTSRALGWAVPGNGPTRPLRSTRRPTLVQRRRMVHGCRCATGSRWYAIVGAQSRSAPPWASHCPPAQPAGGHVEPGAHERADHAGRTLALVEGGIANYELTTSSTPWALRFRRTLAAVTPPTAPRSPNRELHAVSYSFARGRACSTRDRHHGHARRTVDIAVSGRR